MLHVTEISLSSYRKGLREVKTLRSATHIVLKVSNGNEHEFIWMPTKKNLPKIV